MHEGPQQSAQLFLPANATIMRGVYACVPYLGTWRKSSLPQIRLYPLADLNSIWDVRSPDLLPAES